MVKNILKNKGKRHKLTTLGFTLIELLAVIVILAIIALIAVPIILNIVNDSKEESNKRSIDMYAKAVENAIATYQLKEGKGPESIKQLKDLGYIQYDGPEIKCNRNAINEDGSIYLLKCKINNKETIDYEYGEFKLSVKVPTGLTPVVYNGTKWIITNSSSEWYNYEKQEWANAVILNDNVSRTIGTELNVATDVKAMFVYIPRYEYKIEGKYGIHSDGIEGTQALPGEIKVNLISKSQTEASEEGYIVHPAFTFGEEQLEGIWVGKFEISHSDSSKSKTSLACIDENCINSDNLRILPNVTSLINNNVSNFFYGIRSMERSGNAFEIDGNIIDTHMMKNSEWGAVAYLSQSKYGKYGNSEYVGTNKEVYQNKSSSFITGSSNGTPSTSIFTSTQCAYDSTINNCGIGASTTGNITGIYDMSGGSWEYVMGNYSNTIGSSDFSKLPDMKYIDIYIEYENADKGHAVSETSTSKSGTRSWYNDSSSFVSASNPWISRSRSYGDSANAGLFSFYGNGGNAGTADSTRAVLISTTQ